jgi:hypothetical protein
VLNCDIIFPVDYFGGIFMKAKHTDLEKLEQLYKESGNQLVVLYGRRGCQKEEIIVAQSENRRSIIGFCNWDKPMMTMDEL